VNPRKGESGWKVYTGGYQNLHGLFFLKTAQIFYHFALRRRTEGGKEGRISQVEKRVEDRVLVEKRVRAICEKSVACTFKRTGEKNLRDVNPLVSTPVRGGTKGSSPSKGEEDSGQGTREGIRGSMAFQFSAHNLWNLDERITWADQPVEDFFGRKKQV